MKWKQFFTPVKSVTAEEARRIISETPLTDITILDVRQPKEYEAEHIPGATLIPVSDLENRFNEINPEKQTLVYCASGGRSRVATQILIDKKFKDVLNLTGGIKAWNGEKAVLGEEKGLELFTGKESLEETLVTAYGLELGLEEFYISMIKTAENQSVKELFTKLSRIEVKHRSRIFEEYLRLTDKSVSQEEFLSAVYSGASEGGVSTEEYINLYCPDLSSPTNVIDTAISIEAQALDLYYRASKHVEQPESKKFLLQMADEERTHLKQLGILMESVI